MEEPDPLENKIRFGCGFVFGLLLIAFSGFVWWMVAGSAYYVGALSLACGLVLGVLAMRYGDRFWYSMRYWLWFLFGWF